MSLASLVERCSYIYSFRMRLPFSERFSKRSRKKGHRPEDLAWDWGSPKQLSKCTAAEFMRPVKAEERGPPSRLSLKQRATNQRLQISLVVQRDRTTFRGTKLEF